MKMSETWVAALSLAFLGACAGVPTAPSVMALPGTGRSYEDFRIDDSQCRQTALQEVGGVTEDPGVRDAAIGTVIGALAGAAIGGKDGAAVGAGVGLLFGSAAGADAAQNYNYGSQRHYDNVYVQCMYAKGHKVPVSASMVSRGGKAASPYGSGSASGSTSAPAYPPPPPAGPPPSTVPPDYQSPQQPFYYPQPQ